MIITALIAAAVLGHPIPTTCTLQGHNGYYHDGQIELAPLVCAGFSKYATDDQLGVSIFTVAHEAEHALGISDEHQADCAALPLVPVLARRFFKVSAARATRLWTAALVFHQSLPAEYSGPC